MPSDTLSANHERQAVRYDSDLLLLNQIPVGMPGRMSRKGNPTTRPVNSVRKPTLMILASITAQRSIGVTLYLTAIQLVWMASNRFTGRSISMGMVITLTVKTSSAIIPPA